VSGVIEDEVVRYWAECVGFWGVYRVGTDGVGRYQVCFRVKGRYSGEYYGDIFEKLLYNRMEVVGMSIGAVYVVNCLDSVQRLVVSDTNYIRFGRVPDIKVDMITGRVVVDRGTVLYGWDGNVVRSVDDQSGECCEW
jgi:hypothetical protein